MSLPSIVRRSKPPFPVCEFAGLSCATRLELIASWEGRFTGNLAMVPNQEGESPSRKRSSQPTCIHVEECNTSYEVTRNPPGNRKSQGRKLYS